jgi:hypothetical protein
VADASAGGYDAEVVEGRRAPAQEAVALDITLVLAVDILAEGLGGADGGAVSGEGAGGVERKKVAGEASGCDMGPATMPLVRPRPSTSSIPVKPMPAH